jgi:tRNA(Arg) A34 adenosine deaminase TadA
MPKPVSIRIDVPDSVWERCDGVGPLTTLEDRMDLVLDLARANIASGGGPFGAAIFGADGRLIAPGVNRVVAASAPIAHAEIVAIALAGQRLGTWDLASAGGFELVTTTEPCAMCLGAVPWSGVRRLVCGARDTDARSVGFDEGHKPRRWISNLESGGIEVVRDVRRAAARSVLHDYASGGGAIYNGATGSREQANRVDGDA